MRSNCLTGAEFPFCKGKFWRLVVSRQPYIHSQECEYINIQNCTLEMVKMLSFMLYIVQHNKKEICVHKHTHTQLRRTHWTTEHLPHPTPYPPHY